MSVENPIPSHSGGGDAASLPPNKLLLMPNGFDTLRSEGLEVISYTGPYKQFWTLLCGNEIVVNPDIIHYQLKKRCNKIISVLSQYNNTKSHSNLKLEEQVNIKDVIKVKIMKTLRVPEKAAAEILCSYMLFEYNGLVVGLNTLLATPQDRKKITQNIYEFYKRERLCLIYCSQIILANAVDDTHVYHDVFGGFVASASMEDWTKHLCESLQIASCENERIEILHSLSLMIYHYSLYENVVLSFKQHFCRIRDDDMTDRVRLAEAVLFSAVLQCGNENHKLTIQDFITSHLSTVKDNEYMAMPVMSYYYTHFERNSFTRAALQENIDRKRSIVSYTKLVQAYSFDGLNYHHGVGPVALKCGFTAFETIMQKVHTDSLSPKQDLYKLLDSFLKNKEIGRTFLIEQPEKITLLYEEAMYLFPVHIHSVLSIWNSLVHAATNAISPLEILEKVTAINSLAEYVECVGRRDFTVIKNRMILNTERRIGTVEIPVGTKGLVFYIGKNNPIVSWIFEDTCKETVWDVLTHIFLHPFLSGMEIDFNEEMEANILCITNFLIKFVEFSNEISEGMFYLFGIIRRLLLIVEECENEDEKKCEYVALILRLVSCESKFKIEVFREQSCGLWPILDEPNSVSDLIMGHESICNSSFNLTKAFLKTFFELLTTHEEGNSGSIKPGTLRWAMDLYDSGLQFLITIILPSFIRWRFAQIRDKYEILHGCFRVFHKIFNMPDVWDPLKKLICVKLVQPNTSLLELLKTDEEKLQDCRIRPTEANYYLEDTMHLGLSLLLRVTNTDHQAIKLLDTSSGSTLIQCLANLFRHRVIVTVPCLAIKMLTKIALDLNMSILACIRSEAEAFRDLLLLRLSYKSEDSGLRAAILEFLSICVQTQPGMLNHFLQADALPDCLISLLEEEDTSLPPPALSLIRVLIGKGNSILKLNTRNMWETISRPINNIEKFNLYEQRNVITFTMHIFSFELYREGVLDEDLCKEVSNILDTSTIQKFLEIALQDNVDSKCLLAIKHILTLILARADLATMISESTSNELSKLVTEEFWKNKQLGNGEKNELSPALAELMLLFANEQKHDYLETLSSKLVHAFFVESLAVQIPLLACLNKVVANLSNEELSLTTVENLVQIISRIFANASKVYEAEEGKKAQPILSLAASVAYNITQSREAATWLPVFHHQMLVMSIVHVAHIGLTKAVGPEIVLECLGTLIKLCQRPETAACVRNSNLSQQLWIPMIKFATPEAKGKWVEVYLMCCELNTVLIIAEKHFYVEEALNFWGFHGSFLAFKLFDLVEIINHCVLNNADKNYHQLNQTLTFNYFTLHSVSVMLPYLLRWQLNQFESLQGIMDGVFVTLQASVGLLSQPNHLLLVITKNSKGSVPPISFRLTPQLMEVQNKLWDIMFMGVNIYLEIRRLRANFFDCHHLVPLLYNIIALPVKLLSKHGDKRSQPIINNTSKVMLTLEKSLTLLILQIKTHLENPSLTTKQRQSFTRETMSEVISICDSVKRLSFPNEDYSRRICSLLEVIFKDIPN